MMSRVAFVAREVDRAVDVNRQIGIHLDQASIVALIPVVAAPRLVGDVFDGEAFVRRKRHVLQGSLAGTPRSRSEIPSSFSRGITNGRRQAS